VHARKRGVAHVIGRVIVVDSAVEPLTAIRAEDIARLDTHDRRNVRVPAIMPDVLLVGEPFGVIQREQVLSLDPPFRLDGERGVG
jgi:hypothetical protein